MKTVTLLQLNDLHGYLAPHAEAFDLGRETALRAGGGIARIATRFAAIRREAGESVIALDNGDTFHGTMAAVHTRGQALMAPLERLGLDAMTVHWEFAYGLDGLRAIAEQLPYPILAANCRVRGASLKYEPFSIVNRAGIKVALIGLAAVLAPHLLPVEERQVVDVTLGDDELRRLIPALRDQHAVDLVVVLSHLGFAQDYKLAAAVPGIDVIVSGHTHNRLGSPAVVGDTLIIQSGAHGSFVGRLDVQVAKDGVAAWTHALLPVDDAVEPDGAVEALVDEALAPFAAARARVIGETACTLHRYGMFESPMDHLLLDATAAAAGTEIALSNGWRYGTPIPPGPLTEWDLWSIVPANPEVAVVTLSGRQLRDLFEQNLEATFACDPWRQRGGYVKRFRGLEIVAKLENPMGHRIQQVTVGGARLGDEDTVDVAFLGEQAVPAQTGRGQRAVGMHAIEALERYVRRQKTVTPARQGGFDVV